jgi:hypothetical protein
MTTSSRVRMIAYAACSTDAPLPRERETKRHTLTVVDAGQTHGAFSGGRHAA